MLFRRKSHLIAECRVANQFSDTFDRVAFPEIQNLFSVCPLLIDLITFYFKTLTFPFCSMWEAVNTLVESTLVPKWQFGPFACLGAILAWARASGLSFWLRCNSQSATSNNYLLHSGQRSSSTTLPTPIRLGLQMVPMDLGLISLVLPWLAQNNLVMLCLQYLQVEGNPQPIDGDLQLLHLLPLQLMLIYLADHSGLHLLVVEIGEVGQNLAGEHRKHQVYLPPTSQHHHSTDPVPQNCCLNGILVAVSSHLPHCISTKLSLCHMWLQAFQGRHSFWTECTPVFGWHMCELLVNIVYEIMALAVRSLNFWNICFICRIFACCAGSMLTILFGQNKQ